jgi:lipopolysaccharide/colanic/teichoic acid biosynthesis glycosyltransferase
MEEMAWTSEFTEIDSLHSFIPPCRICGDAFTDTCLENPPSSNWSISRTRRLLDFCFALLVLAVFAVPMIVVAACVGLSAGGNPLFTQKRVGMGGRLFRIYKFRTMGENRGKESGRGLTKGGDERVTCLGRYLRKFKLDELPQFINVLRGEMSVIGPRPKLPEYAALTDTTYRPGITGAGTIAFCHEEEILRGVDAARIDTFYSENIKPVKARLDVCYMCKATPASDMHVIASTILGSLVPHYTPGVLIPGPKVVNAAVRAHPGIVSGESVAID